MSHDIITIQWNVEVAGECQKAWANAWETFRKIETLSRKGAECAHADDSVWMVSKDIIFGRVKICFL